MSYCHQDVQAESGGTVWLYPQRVECNKPLLGNMLERYEKALQYIAYL